MKTEDTEKGEQRKDTIEDRWQLKAGSVDFGKESFRMWAEATEARERVLIDDLVESVSWADESALLTGSMTLRRPLVGSDDVDLGLGTALGLRVTLEYALADARFRRLWTMRVATPQRSVKEGVRTLELESDALRMSRIHTSVKYTKGKKARRKGWLPHIIVRDICRKEGVPVAALVKTKTHMEKFIDDDITVWEAIRQCYAHEAKATGKKYVLRWTARGLHVSKFRVPRHKYTFGPSLLDATIAESIKTDNFATAVTVIGHVHVGKKKKREIRLRVVNKRAAKRFGYIHRFLKVKEPFSSLRAARRAGLRELSDSMQFKSEVAFSHPGVPVVARGDAVQLIIPEERFDKIAYINTVTHSVGAGSYDMEVNLRFDDPFVDVFEDEQAEALLDAARRRGRNAAKKKPPRKKKGPAKAGQRAA